MIPRSQKLNPRVFDADVLKETVRRGFGDGLVKAGEENANVLALCADVTDSVFMSQFKSRFKERFIDMGVAEQNMATVASGLSAVGKIPFVGSYAVFSPGRNFEQIRTTVCYNDRPVKIVGSHAGLSVGPDGGSHQALEDIAMMRALPNMTVISPCDAIEAEKATIAMAKTDKPAYIRLSRDKTPIITTKETPFTIGKANIVFEPIAGRPDVAIIATGPLVYEAMIAAKELEAEKIGAVVVNLSTIKPLDTEMILKVAKLAGAIVTVEDHQIAGGMGSAIAEFLAKTKPVPMEFIGVHDKFGQSGTREELYKNYGLSVEDIKTRAIAVVKRARTKTASGTTL